MSGPSGHSLQRFELAKQVFWSRENHAILERQFRLKVPCQPVSHGVTTARTDNSRFAFSNISREAKRGTERSF